MLLDPVLAGPAGGAREENEGEHEITLDEWIKSIKILKIKLDYILFPNLMEPKTFGSFCTIYCMYQWVHSWPGHQQNKTFKLQTYSYDMTDADSILDQKDKWFSITIKYYVIRVPWEHCEHK